MEFNATFLNQGRVDAVLLECDGRFAFVDGGYRRNGIKAVKYMQKMGVKKLDYYIASHGHKNHIGAAAAIIGSIPTDRIIVSRKKVLDAIKRYAATTAEAEAIAKCKTIIIKKGDCVGFGGLTVRCIGPENQRSCSCGAYAENYNSLILRVEDDVYTYWSGMGILLLTGDSSASIIAKCGEDAWAKILKSPHHAGTQPASLISQVHPDDVVICSNVRAGSKYRKRIKKAGASVHNACDGTVKLSFRSGHGNITCEKSLTE